MAIFFEAKKIPGATRSRKQNEDEENEYVMVPEVFSFRGQRQRQLRLALEKKLVEYRVRMSDDDFSAEQQKSALYKAYILNKLLRGDDITVSELRKEFIEEAKEDRTLLGKHADNFDDKLFNNAIGVIYDYLTVGGMNTIDGTGLIERVDE